MNPQYGAGSEAREHIQTQRLSSKRLNVLTKTVIELVGMTPEFNKLNHYTAGYRKPK
jgi:hypothetical protein